MRLRGTALALACALAPATTAAAGAEEAPRAPVPTPSTRFEVNGWRVYPRILSMSGEPERPVAGDVAWIHGIPLLLGAGPEYRFRATGERDDGWVYLLEPGGGERLVGARTDGNFAGAAGAKAERVIVESLSDEELGGLWGLHLDRWDDDVAARVEKIDPARTCLTLTADCCKTVREGARTIPPLPPGLRALVFDECWSECFADLAPLAGQGALALFAISDRSGWTIDLAHLRNSASTLRHLSLGHAELKSPEPLAAFTALRELDVAYSKGVADLGFVRGMADLRRIHLDGTSVEDLGPLGGLARLQVIEAVGSKAKSLPSVSLPALRTLLVMGTGIDAAAAAEFAIAHPECRVSNSWTESLLRELGAADRVRVRSRGLCHRRPEEEKTLVEVVGAPAVRDLVDLFAVEEEGSGFNCMCCGDPTFEFYAGDVLLGSVGFHHGRSLRWPEAWPSDRPLTTESGDRLVEWLAANGAPEPKQDRDEARRKWAEEVREREAFFAFFPEGTPELFRLAAVAAYEGKEDEKSLAAFAATMVERSGGPEPLAAAVCRALGESSDSWTESYGRDPRAIAALRAVTGEAFLAAVTSLGDDRKALLGAARLAFQEGMLAKIPAEARGAVAARLGAAVLEGGKPRNAWRVARALGDVDSKETRALLWRFVEVANPPEEPKPPSLAAAAFISLAKLGDAKAGERVRALLPAAADPDERMALEVALAHLGERGVLRPAHFSGDSDTVVHGAMDAVARSPRREGMEALVEAMKIKEGRARLDLSEGFFRATGWSVPLNSSSRRWARDRCLAWWKRNGEAFLKKHRPGE